MNRAPSGTLPHALTALSSRFENTAHSSTLGRETSSASARSSSSRMPRSAHTAAFIETRASTTWCSHERLQDESMMPTAFISPRDACSASCRCSRSSTAASSRATSSRTRRASSMSADKRRKYCSCACNCSSSRRTRSRDSSRFSDSSNALNSTRSTGPHRAPTTATSANIQKGSS